MAKIDHSLIYYWDSCVFLSYIQNEAGRADIVLGLWEEVTNASGYIMTSWESIIEVAFVQEERSGGRLREDAEARIDAMWRDERIIIVEPNRTIATLARTLIRQAFAQGWSLKPKDAVHLATAQWLCSFTTRPVKEYHTFDTRLVKFAGLAGLTVCEPHTVAPKML